MSTTGNAAQCGGHDEHQSWTLQDLNEEFKSKLYSFAYRILRDAWEAEELVDATLMWFLEECPQSKQSTWRQARSILYRHVRWRALDLRRKRDRSTVHDQLARSAAEDRPIGKPEADADDRRQAVRRALESLPYEQRVVIELRWFHELALKKIAALLDIPLGTVKSRHFNAVKRLREVLGGDDPETP